MPSEWVGIGSGAQREVDDVRIARYSSYLTRKGS
jgi:hypothetical protein